MKRNCDTAGEKLRRRLSALLATLLLVSIFAAWPGLSVTAAAETDQGGSKRSGNEWRDIVDVVAGEGYTVALREDGRVLYAGNDFSGAGQRIASWDRIRRIETLDYGQYLVGYTEDGSIRMEVLLDREEYSRWSFWTESDFASWKGVEQLYISYGFCLGLTEDGTVLALPKEDSYAEICREVSGWREIRQLACGYAAVLGLKQDGTVVCAPISEENGGEIKKFWESSNAPKHIRELVAPGVYGLYVIDENGTVVYGLFGQVWTDVEKLYFASDSMFGLRGDGTVAVDKNVVDWDKRIAEVATWRDIKDLGFEITGWARYVPVGLKEDGTVCAITADGEGQPYGYWDFTGWTDVQKLFSGSDCTIGLRSDGSLLVTGGEFDSLDYQDEIAGWTDIQAIFFAAGEDYTDHVIGLKTDGTLVAAGDNSFGQCNVTG